MQSKALGISWMVILSSKSRAAVKVRNVEKKSETTVDRAELIDFLKSVLVLGGKETLQTTTDLVGVKQKEKENTEFVEVQERGTPAIDVVIHSDTTNSKVKRRFMNSALSRVTPALKRITSVGVVKCLAIDIPQSVLRELVANYDHTSDSIPSKIVDKNAKSREKVTALISFLSKNKQQPFVFVYSTKDDTYETVLFR